MDQQEPYCGIPERVADEQAEAAADGPFAECVLCRRPTEYLESVKGATLCPVCEWREAERTACSG
ncbi:hypothetical protein ACIQ7Q_26400 [Streptomyces sp. NPDC096176]|uniref:hypothetical protein n=1 Tax=Streptomyces sp. NPDC096176 TaxID=3366079 RepID=UPI00381D07D4